MIQTIKLQNITSYCEEGVEIGDLKKVNYFFGRNGSGKSTIAKTLFNAGLLQENRDLQYDHCVVEGYNEHDHQLLVFDEEFISRNFINKVRQNGIFYLDEKNEKAERAIENSESRKEQLSKHYKSLKTKEDEVIERYNENEKDILRFCFNKRGDFKTFYKLGLAYKGNKKTSTETA